jgi:bifunctional UDP-N-acetylglucosamine pyrophosphorylase/glucosamine-1-phosphate N-acetyltransferase
MNQIIVLAGGRGTRMQSELPKVLHNVKGIPIIKRLLKNVEAVFEQPAIVVGYKADEVRAALGDKYIYIQQSEQLGTGHALWCAKECLSHGEYENIIVMPGDHPLISSRTLEDLLVLHQKEKAKISLAIVSAPSFEGDYASFYNCGRIIRNDSGEVAGIVELKDTSEAQKAIRDINVSCYCFDAAWLWENIEKLKSENAAKEYYLTDMVKIAHEQGEKIASFVIENALEGLGVNDKQQLAVVESYL